MRKHPLGGLKSIAAASVIAVALAGCSTIERNRGYVPDPAELAQVHIGEDSRLTVQESLGSPSAIGTFDDSAWYYIRSRHERLAFFRERVIDREVVAIYFDDENRVEDVAHYGFEDGQVVNYSGRRTPTRGREMTILEQLLGNVGRASIPTPQ